MTLVQRLRAREQDAWRRMLHLYTPSVQAWCHHQGVHGADADDVTQDVFQAVATGLEQFQRDRPGDTFRGWLRTITKNKVHDHFRRLQREPSGAGGTDAQVRWAQLPEPAWDDEAPNGDEHQQLFHRALTLIQAEFEERTWRAFWGVVVDSRDPHDVAAELGMSPGAVRVAKCRVLQRLRQELGDFGV